MAHPADFNEGIARSLELMRSRSVILEAGLSDAEVEGVEKTFEFRFRQIFEHSFRRHCRMATIQIGVSDSGD